MLNLPTKEKITFDKFIDELSKKRKEKIQFEFILLSYLRSNNSFVYYTVHLQVQVLLTLKVLSNANKLINNYIKKTYVTHKFPPPHIHGVTMALH